jgi:hypothetical protein
LLDIAFLGSLCMFEFAGQALFMEQRQPPKGFSESADRLIFQGACDP